MALFDFGLAKLRARTQLSRDIDAMSQDELDGLGLTRDSMRAVAFLPEGRKARMTEMAALHGLALDEVTDPRVVSEVSLRCAHCRVAGRCAHDLSASNMDTDAMHYCPNAEVFDALAKA